MGALQETFTINSATLSGNSAASRGGGLFNATGPITLNNSIVAGNSAPTYTNVYGSFTGANNLTSGDSQLAPPGNYGGLTQTMPPIPGSPAIDAGGTKSLSNDQGGFDGVVNSTVDIGAVEFEGDSDVTLFWPTDWHEDGNAFGLELGLGLDPLVPDAGGSGTPAAYPPGVAFGVNPVATNYSPWVVYRSLDLANDPFVQIYRFDGPTGDSITSSVPVTINLISNIMQVTDESLPQPPAAFYRLGIERSP